MTPEPNENTPPTPTEPQPEASEPKQRIRLPKLKATDFQHPLDVAALDAVKRAKGLDFVVRKLNEYGFERWYYINNIADNIRVSQKQCKKVHDILREACDILAVPEPQLYLDQNPFVNAYTMGTERPFIVLQSGLVDFLTEDELLCVIAHEVGHIKCGHVLYKMMAQFLQVIIEIVSDATLGLGKIIGSGLMLAIWEWDRKSELSSDRAGLLAVQNLEVSLNTLMKLAGGCKSIFQQFDRDEFLKQAEDYRELDKEDLNRVFKFLQVYNRTHPFPALRAKEIKQWAEHGSYASILDGSFYTQYIPPPQGYLPPGAGYQGGPGVPPPPPYPGYGGPGGLTDPIVSCPSCYAVQIDPQAKFCFQCGTSLAPPQPPPAAPSNEPKCFNCGHAIKKTDMFCPQCGFNTRLG